MKMSTSLQKNQIEVEVNDFIPIKYFEVMLGGKTDISDFQICAWCNDFLNHPGDNTDNAICAKCLDELGSVPDLEIHGIDRDFVDTLPFGNIVLDPDNIIIRYNATEAKYTGYDSSQIEGKHFFDEVAPCTKEDEFEGKLAQFKEKGENNQYLFKFNFNHPNFQALVSILMTYYSNGYTILSIRKLDDI